MYAIFTAHCDREDREKDYLEHKKRLKDERFQCQCMNWLYHRNRIKFDELTQDAGGADWFRVYCDEKKAETHEQKLLEEKRRIAERENVLRQKLIRQGYCFCRPEVTRCVCGGQRNHLNHHKRIKRRIERIKRTKAKRDAMKTEKIRKSKLENRKRFLIRKKEEEKRWKESFEYTQLLEKAKQKERTKNVIVIETEDDTESDDTDNNAVTRSADEIVRLKLEKKIKDTEREEQVRRLLDEIRLKEQKDRQHDMVCTINKDHDEKSWNVVKFKHKKNV